MMGWMAPLRHLSAKLLSDRISSEWEPSMGEVTTIGLDLAKHVFQAHGVERNREKPAVSLGHRSRSSDEASVRGLHQGQQSIRTA
jgi:hypothetical protein